MESQFILRLPENLQNANLTDAKLTKISKNKVVIEIKNKKYEGVISRPPTVIESQKILDGKLYKIANISGLIVITDEISENGEKEKSDNQTELLSVLNKSGITPPMKYAKDRRFKKTSVKIEVVEEIERLVNDLLAEDAKALKVEIIRQEDQEMDEMVAEIAAEIENEFEEAQVEQIQESPQIKEENEKIKQIKQKINEKMELLEKTTNPILKKRFTENISKLEEELKKLQ
ncbi:hypothetical protein NUSPORA_02141 [Nucleospora cyclopteri]